MQTKEEKFFESKRQFEESIRTIQNCLYFGDNSEQKYYVDRLKQYLLEWESVIKNFKEEK